MPITEGLTGHAEHVVSMANTAASMGSGSLPIYATPSMIALMEQAAVHALQDQLNPGETSVGSHINLSHDDATPLGFKVWAEAEVIAVQGRKITFFVRAFDESGPIGGGTHVRHIVSEDRFLSKAKEKTSVAP